MRQEPLKRMPPIVPLLNTFPNDRGKCKVHEVQNDGGIPAASPKIWTHSSLHTSFSFSDLSSFSFSFLFFLFPYCNPQHKVIIHHD